MRREARGEGFLPVLVRQDPMGEGGNRRSRRGMRPAPKARECRGRSPPPFARTPAAGRHNTPEPPAYGPPPSRSPPNQPPQKRSIQITYQKKRISPPHSLRPHSPPTRPSGQHEPQGCGERHGGRDSFPCRCVKTRWTKEGTGAAGGECGPHPKRGSAEGGRHRPLPGRPQRGDITHRSHRRTEPTPHSDQPQINRPKSAQSKSHTRKKNLPTP
ncbi:hypothetical protein C8D90_10165 [Enterobacillus tribolii]|uniref:Uncharacterized protein n=1 Tax=Enterobacillus tribolii TaxID=1487935 RepID=A0A370R2J3_9GAMM|nr:hypothetical protein C8D90_10165 [Enterobacillus tribolii]